MTKSFLLVVEGLDGTGKSSLVRRLARILNECDNLPGRVKLTFEPHDPSACGVYIRQALLHRIKVPAHTLALAFAVNRADHCNRDIRPFLMQGDPNGRVVICDRYYLSSLVYQSNDAVSMERIMRINEEAMTPDLTIFLSASDKTCYTRMRRREQARELFEVNLRTTRRKYEDAIQFLRQRGESIVEVSAEGSASEVLSRVLDALVSHAPDWLRLQIQPRLFMPEDVDVFEEEDVRIEEVADSLRPVWDVGPLLSLDELAERISDIKRRAEAVVSKLSYSALANAFLSLLKQQGYSVVGRLPWTDVDAIELSYAMPLSVVQRGAVIFMGNSQRYDAILPNLLSGDKIDTLRTMSDFLMILDANPSILHSKYYERDQIRYRNEADVSPTIVVFGRENVRDRVVTCAVRSLWEDFSQTIKALPGGRNIILQHLAGATSTDKFERSDVSSL
jgi:dTMP kinase